MGVVFYSSHFPFILPTYLVHPLGKARGIYWLEAMPPVTRNTRGDGDSGLSTPLTAVVSVASVVVAVTVG